MNLEDENQQARALKDRSQAICAAECEGLFDGGPPARLEMILGLMGPGQKRIYRRAALSVVVSWVPLFVMTAAQTILYNDASFASFVSDYGAHARFLITAPILILAERDCLPELSLLGAHFLTSGLISPRETPKFLDIVLSTRRLRDSLGIEILLLALAIGISIGIVMRVPLDQGPGWHAIELAHGKVVSVAGWWNACVALPLLLLLVFGWVWRLLIWMRFLWLVSRMHLRIMPTHPDKTGGLRFLDVSVQLFTAVALGLSIMVAGTVANGVLNGHGSVAALRDALIGMSIVIVLAIEGPLCVFAGQLRQAWRKGVLEYGILAHHVAFELERKWLYRPRDANPLTTIECTEDPNSFFDIVANVHQMNALPIGTRNLIVLVAVTLLPFIPIVASIIPLAKILKILGGLVL